MLIDTVYPTEFGVAHKAVDKLNKWVNGPNSNIPDPNLFDDFMLFGIPATQTIIDYVKDNPPPKTKSTLSKSEKDALKAKSDLKVKRGRGDYNNASYD